MKAFTWPKPFSPYAPSIIDAPQNLIHAWDHLPYKSKSCRLVLSLAANLTTESSYTSTAARDSSNNFNTPRIIEQIESKSSSAAFAQNLAKLFSASSYMEAQLAPRPHIPKSFKSRCLGLNQTLEPCTGRNRLRSEGS